MDRRVPDDIDEARLADYLIGDFELLDSTLTRFTPLRRLPPAHVAVIECSTMLVRNSAPMPRETRFSSDEGTRGPAGLPRSRRRRVRGFPRVDRCSRRARFASIVCVA